MNDQPGRKITDEMWQEIRAKREATGLSFALLANEFGCTPALIQRHAQREGWRDGKDSETAVRERVADQINGVVGETDPLKKQLAIDAEAGRRAEIVKRHREEPNAVRARLYAGINGHAAAKGKPAKQLAFEDLKAAKIASEAMHIIHSIERKAWGLDIQPTGSSDDPPPSGRFRFVTGSIEIE